MHKDILEDLRLNERTLRKAEEFYQRMRKHAMDGYKQMGHWNWTNSSHWGEDETKQVLRQVEKILPAKRKGLERDLQFGIIDKEKYEFEVGIMNQIEKFLKERFRVLRLR